jgi:hypothetical protein
MEFCFGGALCAGLMRRQQIGAPFSHLKIHATKLMPVAPTRQC